MATELIIEPGRQFASEADFLLSQPPNTIGIETVSARPRIIHTERGPYLIVDHHTDVERRVTISACEQAWDAVNMGLAQSFTDADGNYCATVRVRDCDHDVSLAYDVIDRAEKVPSMTDSQFDRLDKLIRVESMLDAFGGVPPGRITPHLRDIMERIAWMFDPYNSYRASGELYLGNANEHLRVIDENRRNVDRYVAGHENRRPLDTRYRDIGNVGHCFIVERIGAEALLGACSDNKQAVILWQERQDGSNQYTYFRRSALVGFALGGLYNVLNKIEGCPPSQGHGGSDNIGGSPLETGSDIDPGQMLRIIADNPHILAHTTSDIP